MPRRATPMRLCGKQYGSADEARLAKPGAIIETRCPCGAVHARKAPARPLVLPPRPRATGFSARVKLLVRTRAGSGDPEDAACEACGKHLGRLGGQVHHLIDRGMGGCTLAVINGCANAALLCGIPQDKKTCHGLATAFDLEIGERGFWLKHEDDPRLKAMTLHSGARARRTEDGQYLFEGPEAGAA
jgi:hypothetical protein